MSPWLICTFTAVGVAAVVAGAAGSPQGRDIVAAVQRFLLFYAGVFALLALTGAVAAGLVVTDRTVMTPGGRVVGQVVHRVISVAALAALATHIVLEIVAHRSATIDAFVPFLARGRTFYIGLGTIASDLIVLIMLTSLVRGRFAARPGAWRAIHATAYLAWLLGILHGLLAGRTARPYVDWSYGLCAVAVAVALAIRIIAAHRGQAQHRPLPVPGRLPAQMNGGIVIGDHFALPRRRRLAIGDHDRGYPR
ncbi:MAG TPA: hypothetical protein VMA95_18545 [Streptosporangiaceae bacterium]|nr:hypothetical protein [Streptosporangiaceae bacterium]